KKGFPSETSSYDINGVNFWVFYFSDKGADVTSIFCRYHDPKGVVYAYVQLYTPGHYSILHFLKHAIDRYNERLNLGLSESRDVLFHMAKNGLTMVRQDIRTDDEKWLDVYWRNEHGIWIGESEINILDSNTHINLVRTFVDNAKMGWNQEVVLDDNELEKLIAFEETIGGDSYARRKIKQLLDLYKNKPSD
ncbi:MAG: hypothetical protein AAF696_29650, partial [Bacteroidota bacterium]